MKRGLLIVLVIALFMSFSVVGCTQKAANSQEAIEQSKELKTVEEQVKYLISQANAFITSEEFDQAIKTAQYVLANLDKESGNAKIIIEVAQVKLKEAAQGALDDAKKKLGSL